MDDQDMMSYVNIDSTLGRKLCFTWFTQKYYYTNNGVQYIAIELSHSTLEKNNARIGGLKWNFIEGLERELQTTIHYSLWLEDMNSDTSQYWSLSSPSSMK